MEALAGRRARAGRGGGLVDLAAVGADNVEPADDGGRDDRRVLDQLDGLLDLPGGERGKLRREGLRLRGGPDPAPAAPAVAAGTALGAVQAPSAAWG